MSLPLPCSFAMRLSALLAAALLLGACNQSDFSGSGKSAQPTKEPQTEREDNNAEATLGNQSEGKRKKKETKSEDKEEDDLDDVGSVRPSNNPTVVTAGSFSAWAEPPAPARGQDYVITIEVKLPANAVSGYTLSDLTGQLSGTDGYNQSIGVNPVKWTAYDPPIPSTPQDFFVNGRTARVRILVPGALRPLTRDTVTIRSRLLNEQQTLGIQFQ